MMLNGGFIDIIEKKKVFFHAIIPKGSVANSNQAWSQIIKPLRLSNIVSVDFTTVSRA